MYIDKNLMAIVLLVALILILIFFYVLIRKLGTSQIDVRLENIEKILKEIRNGKS